MRSTYLKSYSRCASFLKHKSQCHALLITIFVIDIKHTNLEAEQKNYCRRTQWQINFVIDSQKKKKKKKAL